MHHPFAGVLRQPITEPGLSRRAALGRMLFSAAGVVGLNAAAQAKGSTKAVGEEGELGNALALETTRAIGEEGGMPGAAPTTEPFGEEAGKVTSWFVPGLEDGIRPVAPPPQDSGVSTRRAGEEGGTQAKLEEGIKKPQPENDEEIKKQLEEIKKLKEAELKKQLEVLQAAASTAAIGEEGGQFGGLVQVQPLARDLRPQQLAVVWQDMGDAAAKGPQGCAVLYGCKQSIPFLAKNLDSKVAPADPQRVARLLTQLDDDDFHARERAAADLAALGVAALPALEEALETARSVEVQSRVLRILDEAKDRAAVLQLRRGFEVLVCLKTAEAKEVVKQLADAKAETIATAMARAALPRL